MSIYLMTKAFFTHDCGFGYNSRIVGINYGGLLHCFEEQNAPYQPAIAIDGLSLLVIFIGIYLALA